MNKDALEKIHSKFADEQQCKNVRCGSYFLSKTSENYCPSCREKGFDDDKVLDTQDRLYTEVNVEALSKKVAELEATLAHLGKAEKEPKKFNPKKCAHCGKKFIPTASNQSICDSCRDVLTN